MSRTPSVNQSYLKIPRHPIGPESCSDELQIEVRRMSRRNASPTCNEKQLENAALIALLRCEERYDPKKGHFKHYARRSIKGAMKDERKRTPLFNDTILPIAEQIDSRSSDGLNKRPTADTRYAVKRWERETRAEREWEQAIDGMPSEDLEILFERYEQGLSQTEIARTRQISQQLVSQRLARAKQHIKRNLAAVA
mgnify:CR=1 FL=1